MTKNKIGGRIEEHKGWIKMNWSNTARTKHNNAFRLHIDFDNIDNFTNLNNISLKETIEITTQGSNVRNNILLSIIDNRWWCLLNFNK